MAEDADALAGLDTAMLGPMVRDLLGEPTAVVAEEWSCRPLGGGGGEGLGLYRVTGSAHVESATHPWALVVKVYAAADGADPGAWDYPAREGLAYGSGLLAALPGGLATPRCLAVETQPDGTARLWLEAVTDAHPGPWPLDRYAQVARHLGHFNGAYLAGTPLPDQPWLSRGWLRDFVEPSGPAVADLERLADPGGSPLAAAALPAARRRRDAPTVGGAGALPRGPGPAATDLLPPRCFPAQPAAPGGAGRRGARGRRLGVRGPRRGRGGAGAAGGGQPRLLRGRWASLRATSMRPASPAM